MINISKLYCDQVTPGDWLRYGSERRPIVVWNITRACNLKCVHCYNDSGACKADDELATDEAKGVLDDLVQFRVPSVLFSGGEPLMRPDLFELIGYAVKRGVRAVISTNGTLITTEMAKRVKDHGVSYVGISLDGIGPVNDKFRGVSGAFERAVAGIKNCQEAGVRIGLRLTLTGKNVQDLESLFDFFEAQQIERACFYHFVPSGRGGTMADEDLTHAQSRDAVEMILAKTKLFKQAGRTTDI
ncbi:MAG: radical SAM protein, partial [Planctomycetota bacterium]